MCVCVCVCVFAVFQFDSFLWAPLAGQDLPRTEFDFMGYTIRTTEFRYMEWRHWIGANLTVDWNAAPAEIELYDHRNSTALQSNNKAQDPFQTETINVAKHPDYHQTAAALAKTLREQFEPRAV